MTCAVAWLPSTMADVKRPFIERQVARAKQATEGPAKETLDPGKSPGNPKHIWSASELDTGTDRSLRDGSYSVQGQAEKSVSSRCLSNFASTCWLMMQ